MFMKLFKSLLLLDILVSGSPGGRLLIVRLGRFHPGLCLGSPNSIVQTGPVH